MRLSSSKELQFKSHFLTILRHLTTPFQPTTQDSNMRIKGVMSAF